MDRINPIVIRDNESGEVLYTLDFSRKTLAKMERAGYHPRQIADRPLTGSQDLLYFAFLMHHPFIKRELTDELFEQLGGTKNEDLFMGLIKLYNQAMDSTGAEKNSKFVLDI